MRALLLAAALLVGCAPALPPPRTTVVAAPRNDLAGLSNFAKVSLTLYRGAQPSREGFETLKRLGVRTVVNLRSKHSDREALAGLGLVYVELPSHPWEPRSDRVAQVLALARDPAHAPVFVHCEHGADRTGYTVASYRIVEQGWDRDRALRELRVFGFHSIWGNIPSFLADLDARAMDERVRTTPPPEGQVL